MRPIGFVETSVTDYQSTLCKIPEGRRSHLYRGGSLKPRKGLFFIRNTFKFNLLLSLSLYIYIYIYNADYGCSLRGTNCIIVCYLKERFRSEYFNFFSNLADSEGCL